MIVMVIINCNGARKIFKENEMKLEVEKTQKFDSEI